MTLAIAVLARFIIGMLWYSPVMFGKTWMDALKLDSMKGGMGKGIAVSIIGAAIMAIILNLFMSSMSVTGFVQGAIIGVWAWLGFIAVTFLEMTVYENRSMKVFIIGAGYNLISLIVMGGILAI